ncbi:LysR family transcriptional regulator [Arthrobacter crystallopoietes BAB-32]|uniref:LysR family transcriptional regulator n=1 Tax=Arthrobacter crystallopoietes BAB-32 TaxID=1246476 RepID=N1UZI6_9MICC|nr:LysR substrate-binding domain-containing protein [Arthrobacter crystallopoietes]EMY33232.1 LysR family transcriptional regulator [Arthrobacter crystallopoietes BAB-32]
MLDIRRLRILRELKIRGTLAEVAAALNYSPSSVSQQLSLLEKEAGLELLRKTGRRVQLTPQAEILVAHTEQLLQRLERAETDLAASLTTVTGTVRVAVFQSAALALMPQALAEMRRRHPEVRIEMVQREPETALYETWARDFDLVVAEQYPGHAAPHHPDLDRQQLTTDAIRLAVPADATELGGVDSVDDAKALPWVMEPHGAASRHWAEQACRSAGFEPDVRYETADLQAQIRLVESGNAVAFMPDLMWTGRPHGCRLLELPSRPRRTIFTSVRSASAHHPAIAAFREVLGQAAAGI